MKYGLPENYQPSFPKDDYSEVGFIPMARQDEANLEFDHGNQSNATHEYYPGDRIFGYIDYEN